MDGSPYRISVGLEPRCIAAEGRADDQKQTSSSAPHMLDYSVEPASVGCPGSESRGRGSSIKVTGFGVLQTVKPTLHSRHIRTSGMLVIKLYTAPKCLFEDS